MAAATRDLAPAEFDPEGDLLALVHDLQMTAIVGMMDPPRPESLDAVRAAQDANIRVRMVTGDDVITGAAIAKQLGIPGEAVMGLVGPAFVGGTGALVFLLAAEVVAATAVVSEAALVYIARFQNLMISLATITVQAVLTVGGILLVDHLHLGQLYRAAAAAAALMLSLAIASLAKSRLLSHKLGEPINNWRWGLVWAAAPAIVVGWLAKRFLPEWAELALGIPAILAAYCWTIWHKGFGPEDRVLFRKQGAAAE